MREVQKPYKLPTRKFCPVRKVLVCTYKIAPKSSQNITPIVVSYICGKGLIIQLCRGFVLPSDFRATKRMSTQMKVCFIQDHHRHHHCHDCNHNQCHHHKNVSHPIVVAGAGHWAGGQKLEEKTWLLIKTNKIYWLQKFNWRKTSYCWWTRKMEKMLQKIIVDEKTKNTFFINLIGE